MMNDFRVVAVIPAGRKRYLEILIPYLRAQKGILDSCQFWCNTTDPNDIAYMHQIAGQDPFFKVITPTIPVNGTWTIYQFFRGCIDAKTVYVRFDDDICWIAPDAVEELVKFRIAHPEYFLVYANIVNNSICSHLHQRQCCFDLSEGFCEYDVMGAVSHRSGPLARLAHHSFLQKLDARQLEKYHFSQWVLWHYERVSINCISWLGSDFAEFGGEVGADEEQWLSVEQPRHLRRPTAICGTALVAHFAYYTQRDWLEAHTDLLERYRGLAAVTGDV